LTTLSIDDAIALFVQKLRTGPPLLAGYDANARHTTEGCDIRVTDVLGEWWHREQRRCYAGAWWRVIRHRCRFQFLCLTRCRYAF
jgi:hypothetical protein